MVKVLYDHSYSRITGLDDKDFSDLRKLLSYKLDNTRFMANPFHHLQYCIDKKGTFASGLWPTVQKFLYARKIRMHLSMPTMLPPSTIAHRAFKPAYNRIPYPDQQSALLATTQADRGVISAPTGTGKSHIIAMILEHHKMRALIIVPTVELKNQLTQTLKEALTSMEGITVLNIDSSDLKQATEYDMLIIDEVHHAAAKTYRNLNKTAWNHIRYRFSLSATPFRNNPEEQMLYESIAGQVIYKLSYHRAVQQGYIVPVEAYYLEVPKAPTEGATYQQVYQEAIVNNPELNKTVADLLISLAGVPTLCLVKEIKHGQALSEMTGIPFVNGADEDSRAYIKQFNSGRIKALIGTTGILGEGVDTKPCEYVIIAGSGKAKSSFMQAVGRAVRTFPGKESAKVIIFRNPSHKWFLKHFREQVKILRDEYGVEVIKL